jgi:hypothetical protein
MDAGAAILDRTAEAYPIWGDFGGKCLAGACRASRELYLQGARPFGLERAGSYLLGTWRTGDGEIHRFLRALGNFNAPIPCSVFSTKGEKRLARIPNEEASTYSGGIAVTSDADQVHFQPPGGGSAFRHSIGEAEAVWEEGDLLFVKGSLAAIPTQWFNPWRGGGGAYALTAKFRGTALIAGQPAEGFFAHETHFFPPGQNFMASPFGWGGREIHWGHMATAFDDGSVIDASLACGADGWGFAMLTDERGVFHSTTDVEVSADVRPNGYPERIVYRFLDQEWCWQIDPKGERADVQSNGMIGAEGTLTRLGETRRVVAAMGTIDWWCDGRAAVIPRATAKSRFCR